VASLHLILGLSISFDDTFKRMSFKTALFFIFFKDNTMTKNTIETQTEHYGFKLPHSENTLQTDVNRIRDSFDMIDLELTQKANTAWAQISLVGDDYQEEVFYPVCLHHGLTLGVGQIEIRNSWYDYANSHSGTINCIFKVHGSAYNNNYPYIALQTYVHAGFDLLADYQINGHTDQVFVWLRGGRNYQIRHNLNKLHPLPALQETTVEKLNLKDFEIQVLPHGWQDYQLKHEINRDKVKQGYFNLCDWAFLLESTKDHKQSIESMQKGGVVHGDISIESNREVSRFRVGQDDKNYTAIMDLRDKGYSLISVVSKRESDGVAVGRNLIKLYHDTENGYVDFWGYPTIQGKRIATQDHVKQSIDTLYKHNIAEKINGVVVSKQGQIKRFFVTNGLSTGGYTKSAGPDKDFPHCANPQSPYYLNLLEFKSGQHYGEPGDYFKIEFLMTHRAMFAKDFYTDHFIITGSSWHDCVSAQVEIKKATGSVSFYSSYPTEDAKKLKLTRDLEGSTQLIYFHDINQGTDATPRVTLEVDSRHHCGAQRHFSADVTYTSSRAQPAKDLITQTAPKWNVA
jgi:hypothetical protein